MKRSDPVTHRFIQYMQMKAGDTLILVLDGKTQSVIIAPHEEHRWLERIKSGLGRASKAEWTETRKVDYDFLDEAHADQEWDFDFDEYYEIYLWDFLAGENGFDSFRNIMDVSIFLLFCLFHLLRHITNFHSDALESKTDTNCSRSF